MHSSGMRTARFSGRGGGCLSLFTDTPVHRDTLHRDPPFTETFLSQRPLHRDLPFTETPFTETPRQRPPGQRQPWKETPQKEHGTRHRDPHPRQNDWHTPVKILPCPKLRLRAVNIMYIVKI